MTTDSHLFEVKPSKNRLPLWEGKMFWQFQWNYDAPKYWIAEKVAFSLLKESRYKNYKKLVKLNTNLLTKVDDNPDFKLDYSTYRLAFRDVTASTNERTMIMTLLPPKRFCPHTVSLEQVYISEIIKREIEPNHTELTNSDRLYLLGFFNSFVVDAYLRRSVTNHLSFFIVNNTPIPRLKSTELLYNSIVELVLKLVCISQEFEELWKEITNTKWGKGKVALKENDRAKLRAELDGYVAHIYGLTEEEFSYILGTFPIVKQDQKDAALQSYKDLALQFIKSGSPSISDLSELIQKGEHKKLEFKSTLMWDIKESTRKYHIEHSVIKTIAAFLNSTGGTLLIGVKDDGQIHGLEDDFKVLGSKGDPRDNFNKAFDNLISNNFGRDIHRLIQLSLESIEGKLIAKVEVKEKAPEEVFLANKDKNSIEEFYVRLNASSVALTGKEQSKYIRQHWK